MESKAEMIDRAVVSEVALLRHHVEQLPQPVDLRLHHLRIGGKRSLRGDLFGEQGGHVAAFAGIGQFDHRGLHLLRCGHHAGHGTGNANGAHGGTLAARS